MVVALISPSFVLGTATLIPWLVVAVSLGMYEKEPSFFLKVSCFLADISIVEGADSKSFARESATSCAFFGSPWAKLDERFLKILSRAIQML